MKETLNITNEDVLEFVVFCIENLAIALNTTGDKVYRALKDSDILYGYIVPLYEVLHTQGKEYIVADIIEVMKERNVKI